MRFRCQLASIFPPKIHQNPFKNRSQDASIFWLIFEWIFEPSWLHLGGQVGAMLATFSKKKGGREISSCLLSSFLLGLSYFSILAPSGLPFGAMWVRFWKVLGLDFQDFPSRFGLDFSGFPRGFGLDFGSFPWGFRREVGPSGRKAGTGWAGGVTRSAKNSLFDSNMFLIILSFHEDSDVRGPRP